MSKTGRISRIDFETNKKPQGPGTVLIPFSQEVIRVISDSPDLHELFFSTALKTFEVARRNYLSLALVSATAVQHLHRPAETDDSAKLFAIELANALRRACL